MDQVRRQLVPRIGSLGERIHYRSREIGKIAGALLCGRQVAGGSQGFSLAESLPRKQPEQTVLDDRTVCRDAVLVALERWNRLVAAVEEVLRIESGVAQELEGRAMDRVRPALGRDVDLRNRSAVLRLENAALYLELL